MCGIIGLFNQELSFERRNHAIACMTQALKNRGPDDQGLWVDPASGLALGHRRLSILDLSAEGHQPMRSASGRFMMVFNGEVYNFAELRHTLEQKNYRFRGHSDSEVLLAAFEEWGVERSVPRFNGMFAIGLWDHHERCLWLIRDRMGVKPLYYGWLPQGFLFASEIKALEACPGFNAEVDRNALCQMLRHNCIGAPHSIYQGIYKLWQSSILKLSQAELLAKPNNFSADYLDSRSLVRPRMYWSAREQVEQGIKNPFGGQQSEAIQQLHDLLKDAIGLRMISDVPLGAFLSGGIDSSLVVALMQAQNSKPIKTFSIGFAEDQYNEAQYAKLVAQHLKTDHTELYVSAEMALDVIPKLPLLYDEPFADSSQIPTYLLAMLARKQVTVSLSGDGGDELFGGYTRYLSARKIMQAIKLVPAPLRQMVARLIQSFPRERWASVLQAFLTLVPASKRVSHPADKLLKLAKALRASSTEDIYLQMISHWDEPEMLVRSGHEASCIVSNPLARANLPQVEQQMMYLDLMHYLPDEVMVKVDRATMSASLEAREPLLDYRLFELAASFPLDYKIRSGQGKWILRQVLYQYVPPHLIERPKMGFGVPIGSWLRGPLKQWASELLDEKRLDQEGFLNSGPIQRYWREHLEGRQNWQYHLWDVLMFQAWLENRKQSRSQPELSTAQIQAAVV